MPPGACPLGCKPHPNNPTHEPCPHRSVDTHPKPPNSWFALWTNVLNEKTVSLSTNLLRLWRSPLRKDRPVALVLLWLHFLWFCLGAFFWLTTLWPQISGLVRIFAGQDLQPLLATMLTTCAFAVACLFLYVLGRALWRVHFWPYVLSCLSRLVFCAIFSFNILPPESVVVPFDRGILYLAVSLIALAACFRVRGGINHSGGPHLAQSSAA